MVGTAVVVLASQVIRPLRASLGGAEPAPAQSLEAEFQARAEAAKTLTRLPDKQRLELYGLFKQVCGEATSQPADAEGRCNAASPAPLDPCDGGYDTTSEGRLIQMGIVIRCSQKSDCVGAVARKTRFVCFSSLAVGRAVHFFSQYTILFS